MHHHVDDTIGAKSAPGAACDAVRSMSEAAAVRADLINNFDHTVGGMLTAGWPPLAARVIMNRLLQATQVPAHLVAECGHSFR